ncbi:MAG: sigma-54 interaction domain-containing protein [Negativicutes bacterium]
MRPGTKAIVVGNTQERAEFALNAIRQFGIHYLDLQIYYPGCDLENSGEIQLAIITGEDRHVPGWITTIIDLGVKEIGLPTYFEIIHYLDIPPIVFGDIAQLYMKAIFDLTLRQHGVAQANSEMRRRMEVTLKNVDDAILSVDTAGIIQTANPACGKLLVAPPPLIGSNIQNAINGVDFAQCLLSGSGVSDEVVLIGDQHYLLSVNPIQHHSGAISGAVVIIRPVSKVQKMETKVRRELAAKGNVAKYTFEKISGDSVELQKTLTLARRFAKTDLSILIEGESGVGKELFAQSIHNVSKRASGPFVALNFAALPEHLAESELFGYEEGAFTGAKKGGKRGLFEEAHLGTLFLDEIGDASLELQAKLLRVLEEKEVRRVGGRENTPIDVRVITATNKNLAHLVKEGKFRNDLFYRLCTLPISIPPLRNRGQDLFLLIDSFAASMYNRRLALEPSLTRLLAAYDWPGNVREVQNVLRYICNFVDRDVIVRTEDLPGYLKEAIVTLPIADKASGTAGENEYIFIKQMDKRGTTGLVIEILRQLKNASQEGRALGRGSLALLLEAKGIVVPHYKIRDCLSALSKRKYLDVGITRQGAKINLQGVELLRCLDDRTV